MKDKFFAAAMVAVVIGAVAVIVQKRKQAN